MTETLGERFAHALAARDATGLSALLTDDVDFRALTPSRFWEGQDPGSVVDAALGHWFEESDHIESVRRVEVGEDVGEVHRVAYRFDVSNADGRSSVEQQAYYKVADGRISYLRMICSGFQPRTG